jgi:hypothetical protein
VIWDPSVLLCEGTEVIMPSRLVRVSLCVKTDGTPLHLVGAYMPVRQAGQDDEVDEAWAALDVEALAITLAAGARRHAGEDGAGG